MPSWGDLLFMNILILLAFMCLIMDGCKIGELRGKQRALETRIANIERNR